MLSRLLLLLLTATALALAACGDDEDSGTTKAEFIEKADAICQEGEDKGEELARNGFEDPRNPTGPEILALLEDLVPIQRQTIEDVRELEKPEGDEDEINEFLTLAEQATDQADEIEDPQQALAFLRSSDTPDDPFQEADKAARDYGLEVCGD